MIDGTGQGAGPAGTGREDLWADIFHQTDVGVLLPDALGHAQHESPTVDQDDHVRLRPDDVGDRLGDAFLEQAEGFQPVKEAEDGQAGDIDRAVDTFRSHRLATHTRQGDVIPGLRLELPDQSGAQQVTRAFRRNDIDRVRLTHVRAPPDPQS